MRGPHDHRAGHSDAGLRGGHGGAHAVDPGLVARREDDAFADDDRAVPQARVVPLLDRGVEAVEVGVEDPGADRLVIGAA